MKLKGIFTGFYYIDTTIVTPHFLVGGINELILRIRGVNCKLKYFIKQIQVKRKLNNGLKLMLDS